MAKPKGVVPSDNGVIIFNEIIKKAYSDVFKLLSTEDLTKNRKQILKKVDNIILEANKDVQAWIRIEVPSFYEMGMWDVTVDLYELDTLKNVNFNYEYAKVHKDIIDSISRETYAEIASGMTGLNKTASRMITTAIRETALRTVVTGQSSGLTIKEVKKKIAEALRKEGITAFVDKGGSKWSLERYGEMLSRTKLTQAHVSGSVNRMIGGGYDLIQISDHSGECPLCRPWENKVLSISGVNKEYSSLSEAKSAGLFHPNCKHAISAYNADFLADTKVWDSQKKKYVPYGELNKSQKLAKVG